MGLLNWLRGWSSRKPVSPGKRRRQPEGRKHFGKLTVDVLEDRILLSTVTWNNPGSGNWDTAANWSSGSVPGAADDVVVPNAAITVTVQSGDAESVHSLTTGSNATLSIAGGSLTVAGTSTLGGALAMTGGSLTANGPGIAVVANGPTSVSGADLYAQGGATLSLPNLTSVTEDPTSSSQVFIEASGATVNLPALTSINTGTVILESQGTGAVLNISGLTSFNYTGTGTHSDLEDGSGATVLYGNLTSLTNAALDVSGSGKSVTLPSLTNIDGSYISATEGATLSLPGVTSDTGGNLQADFAAASTLTLANLTSASATKIEAIGNGADESGPGGTVNLPALTQVNGAVSLISAGASSLLNLPSLTNFNTTSGSASVQVGGSLQVGSNLLTMPNSGTGVTVNVPQLPGMSVSLFGYGPFAGGTTVNVAAGDAVNLGFFILTGGGGLTLNAGAGTSVELTGAQYMGGATLNVAAGGTVDLTGGQGVTYSGLLTGSGAGTVQLNSGTLGIGQGGLTLNFAGTMFQWTGGSVNAAGRTLTNLGTINLTGSTYEYFTGDGTLDNFGTILQTGAGYLALQSDGVSPATLKNESGGRYLLESDGGITMSAQALSNIDNAGIIQKTAGTGKSTLLVNLLTNTGTIESDSGDLKLTPNSVAQVQNGTLAGGTWNVKNGAMLEWAPGFNVTDNEATVALDGAGATMTNLAGLTTNGGSFSLTNGAALATAAGFTNSGTLTVGAGSRLTVPGSYTQTSSGTLGVQIGGPSPSGLFGQVNAGGAANLAGTFNVALANGYNPVGGQSYQVLSAGGVAGSFTTVTGLPAGMTATQTGTAVILSLGGGAGQPGAPVPTTPPQPPPPPPAPVGHHGKKGHRAHHGRRKGHHTLHRRPE